MHSLLSQSCQELVNSLLFHSPLPWGRVTRIPREELPLIKLNQTSVFTRRFDRQIVFPVRLRYDNDDNSSFSSQMALESFPAVTVCECQRVYLSAGKD